MKLPLALAVLALATSGSSAKRALPDYRYFRALSIDLQGRSPNLDELADFERPEFKLDAWIEARLVAPAYAERIRRIYMDRLRLELGPQFQYVPPSVVLRTIEIQDPDGKPVNVMFRRGQRRADAAIDGDFCFSAAETGMQVPPNGAPIGTAKPIDRATFEARTVVVKPWWLYADYRREAPTDRVAPDWAQRFPGFVPVPALVAETSVRVCKEEAQLGETGTVYLSGRAAARKGDPLPGGRLTQPPNDSPFARKEKGHAVSCTSGLGFQSSLDCGCGVGLERCMPGAGPQFDPPAFVLPTRDPLDLATPFGATPQPASAWSRMWWGEEARHFLDVIFLEDRDIREILTSRTTYVNGPLAQFYRFIASATCCNGADLGYVQPDPLVDPSRIPTALVPEDTTTWLPVPDRGPHASGILTMPVFLTKYGSRRARAHVVYQAFLCKEFVADSVKLAPSSEPDLTKRPGCSTCHQTLEPMAAYFTRIEESNWTFLPPENFPMSLPRCTGADPTKLPGSCKQIYDPAFTDATHTVLRGAYASPSHAEAGPAGLAAEIARAPELPGCVVENIAESLLGRPLAPEDEPWKIELAKQFVDGGYRVRTLVRAILTSPRYRDANDERRAP